MALGIHRVSVEITTIVVMASPVEEKDSEIKFLGELAPDLGDDCLK